MGETVFSDGIMFMVLCTCSKRAKIVFKRLIVLSNLHQLSHTFRNLYFSFDELLCVQHL